LFANAGWRTHHQLRDESNECTSSDSERVAVTQASASATQAPDAAVRAAALRGRIRRAELSGHTSGLADDLVQANLVVLPQAQAYDFLLYCQRNPRPCPLLAVTDAGAVTVPALGQDIDLRTDLPRYRVWERGVLVDEPTDVTAIWRDDLVAFAIGCSFSFEWALQTRGMRLRHVDQGRNVAMFRTSLPTVAAGMFSGPMVVSMRPLLPADALRAAQITARYPSVHGAPVHMGDPAAIGIADLDHPDYGDAVEVLPGEIPVFWACGVTPQAAISQARPPFCITHAPGAMLITDLFNHELEAL
jgi:uncharacterized protein YcsI (UPF0317 family)